MLLLSQKYDITWHLNASHDVFQAVLLQWNHCWNHAIAKMDLIPRKLVYSCSFIPQVSDSLFWVFKISFLEKRYVCRLRIWIVWASINIRVLIETVVNGSKTFPNTWKYFSLSNNAWNLNIEILNITKSVI